MSILFLLQILFGVIFLLLFIFYGLVIFAIRRAARSTKIPVPLVWKFLLVFNTLVLIISFLFIISRR